MVQVSAEAGRGASAKEGWASFDEDVPRVGNLFAPSASWNHENSLRAGPPRAVTP